MRRVAERLHQLVDPRLHSFALPLRARHDCARARGLPLAPPPPDPASRILLLLCRQTRQPQLEGEITRSPPHIGFHI
eukprot:753610-Pyramimonas_sp.AAC.1